MPYASNLRLVPPPEALPIKPACRKCLRTDIAFVKYRDKLCVECNRKIVHAWQAAHPEQRRKQSREGSARSRVRYPERYLWHSAKQRAKKIGVPFEIRPEDVIIPPCCPVLGIPLQAKFGRGGCDSSPSLDRIVPERGYVIGNIAVISNRANRIKSNATAEEIERVAAWLRTTLDRRLR